MVRMRCLRHCESQNVVDGVSGAVRLAPLTAAGRVQAAALGRELALEPITRVYTSVAVRARDTARFVATAARMELVEVPELSEVHLGEKDGTTDPLTGRRTAEVLHAWIVRGDLSQRVADGETGHQVVERMIAAFDAIAAAHHTETVVVVGHVASLTVGLAALCPGLGQQVWGHPLPPGRPVTVQRNGPTWTCPDWPIEGPEATVIARLLSR